MTDQADSVSGLSANRRGVDAPRRTRLSNEARIGAWGLSFVLPVVVFFTVFAIIPAILGFYLSLTEYNIVKPPVFVGLQNYAELPSDRLFLKALSNTAVFVLGATVPVVIISLLLALLLNQQMPGATFLKTLAFSPILPPLAVVAVVWKLLLHPNGPLTGIVGPLLGVSEIRWLNDPTLASAAMIVVHDWTIIPLFTMIWLAGLAGVPKELQEAALVDGAGRVAAFVHITLPVLKPTAVLVTSLATINAFQSFVLQFVLAPDKGGPADSTLTLALLVWRYAFQYFRMGDAAAISVLLFAAIMGITVLQLHLGRSK